MSTRLKSSRREISLTRFSGVREQWGGRIAGKVMKVHVNMRDTFRVGVDSDGVAMFDSISLTRSQAQALGQDLLAFGNEMEEEAEYEKV